MSAHFIQGPFHGSCLCGAVGFSVEAVCASTAHCHCRMCRKFHGAAFGALVETRGFHWTQGADSVAEYTGQNGTVRSFCCQCGSSLGFRGKGVALEKMEVALSAFDQPVPVTIEAHIFTHYKADWYQIDDGLPQYPEGRVND